MAYAYVQRIWPQVRQVKTRDFPNTGNAEGTVLLHL
jgi:hypothetical protein